MKITYKMLSPKAKKLEDNTDFVFLLVVIFFISLILWTVIYSYCYFNRRTARQFNIANNYHPNHRSIDSGFGKLYYF